MEQIRTSFPYERDDGGGGQPLYQANGQVDRLHEQQESRQRQTADARHLCFKHNPEGPHLHADDRRKHGNDFALVCGSERNLREDTDKGLFLRDLYHRINGLTVKLPALRERSDFQKITELLLNEIMPGQDVYLAPDLLAQLGRHPWPGNVHQYATVLRAASAMLDSDEKQINWKHLTDDLVDELTKMPQVAPLEIAPPPQRRKTSKSFPVRPSSTPWKAVTAIFRKQHAAWASADNAVPQAEHLNSASGSTGRRHRRA